MSQFVRSTTGRTSESRSYRWIAVVTIVAMLGFAGFVFAASGNNQGAKLVPLGQDTKAAKASAMMLTADGEQAPTNSSSHSGNAPAAAPANDDCSGAIVIPSGSLPVVTAPVDITEATPVSAGNGTGGELFCTSFERTVWYSFTPTASANYTFATCPSTSPGNNLVDTVIAVFDSCGGAQLGCNDTGACHGPTDDTSIAAAVLTAGNTYFVAVGHWGGSGGGAPNNDPIGPGNDTVQVQVDVSPAPSNDTCGAGGANAIPLFLNRVVQGTTAAATNDYRSDAAATCFSGVGQTGTSSAGVDVVFKFDPPADGLYSFRYVQDDASAALRGQNPVLYLSHSCPAPAPNGPVVSCNPALGDKGANRITCTPPCSPNTATNGNRSEMIDCTPLRVADGTAYIYFDDRAAGNAGGPLAIEVTQCYPESEPNDDIASANPYPGCYTTGAMNTAADVDFFSIGQPAAGAKLFAAIDGAAANALDYEMRITNTQDTLGYDDNDGTSWVGLNSPNIGGAVADGNPLYVRVNKGSLATELVPSAPYRLYTRIESGTAQNEVDTPSNASYYFGNVVTAGGFVRGIHATATDQDCFRFVAHEGDDIMAMSDNNPDRVGGPIVNTWPILRDLVLAPPTATRFTGQILRNIATPYPSPGLTGYTPDIVSEFWNYRARYTGTYMACWYPDGPAAGYPLPYQGSISLNCGPVPSPASQNTDISVTKTGPAGPVNTGDFIQYTITLTNNSATDIAVDARIQDQLPTGLSFLGLNVNDGFNGNNVGCIALPSPGANDDIVDCTVFSIAPGASVTYTLSAQVNNCSGAGQTIDNTVTVSSLSNDTNSSNNSASWTFTTQETGSCQDLLCDSTGCVADNCTFNEHCEAGACVSSAVDCDDHSLCTDDSCDPFVEQVDANCDGRLDVCINDSSLLGDLCNDGNACTGDACDPDLFCVFPPKAAGTTCDDFLNCTVPDACDGEGACVGRSVCDDGLPCTDDIADEGNNCACINDPSFPGTLCDADPCRTGFCDGSGPTAASCQVTGLRNCDDGNPCTDDSCNPATGCVNAYNTNACDDGSACTTNDSCRSGVCAGDALDCNDGNSCTDDTCDPNGVGCRHCDNTDSCDDGNACTGNDICGGGSCVGAVAVVCNDDNPCTDDSCNPATGCVFDNNTAACDDGNPCTVGDACSGGACASGTPVVCTPQDQCHDAGVCFPGTGLCSNPQKSDGTVCDDASLCTTGETCQAGICTPAYSGLNEPKPKSSGYYKQLCKKARQGHVPYHGDQITDADAQCVSELTCRFNFTTAAELCSSDHDSDHDSDTPGERSRDKYCVKADQELIATALNICRARVCEEQAVDSRCGHDGHDSEHDSELHLTTVGASFHDADSILCSPDPTRDDCKDARCELKEINSGKALRMNSLACSLDSGKVRLTWQSPEYDDGTSRPNGYEIWRRPLGASSGYTRIGITNNLTFLDVNSAIGFWEYEVTPILP